MERTFSSVRFFKILALINWTETFQVWSDRKLWQIMFRKPFREGWVSHLCIRWPSHVSHNVKRCGIIQEVSISTSSLSTTPCNEMGICGAKTSPIGQLAPPDLDGRTHHAQAVAVTVQRVGRQGLSRIENESYKTVLFCIKIVLLFVYFFTTINLKNACLTSNNKGSVFGCTWYSSQQWSTRWRSFSKRPNLKNSKSFGLRPTGCALCFINDLVRWFDLLLICTRQHVELVPQVLGTR